MVWQWFLVQQPLMPMVLKFSNNWTQWFPMVGNHWSNDGMVTIHRYGLIGVLFWVPFSISQHTNGIRLNSWLGRWLELVNTISFWEKSGDAPSLYPSDHHPSPNISFRHHSSHCKGRPWGPFWMFFWTLFKRPLTPPPLVLNIYVADFSKGLLKKCVNACRDKCVKIVRKSLGKNVQYTKKLWQFYL